MPEADAAAPAPGDVLARAQAALLPLLPRVVEVYRGLAELPVPDDPKLVVAQQQACKAALAHIEALLKLIPLAAPPGGAGGDGGGAAGLVARAEKAFESYRGEGA